MLGLYLHIPFCQAICSYCNFNRGLLDVDLRRRYVDALEREIRSSSSDSVLEGPDASPGDRPAADTIFFGGGTPSLLEPEEVRRLIGACRDTYALSADAEITLETNPETATPGRLAAFREAGVTRLSFGVQSFDDAELRRLGRLHSSERAKAAVHDAKRTGFATVSFDLMFWLPGQTLGSWAHTVEEAIALDPDHLSLYLLELYPNAPLKEAMARAGAPAAAVPSESASRGAAARGGGAPRAGIVGPGEESESASAAARARGGGAPRAMNADWSQAADDEAADMYLLALDQLDDAGYEQYEISNVSKPAHQSRHNLKYWQAGDWRGFGCGAHSTVAGTRWRNLASTVDYVERLARSQPVEIERTVLTSQDRLEEALFTGLRLSAGVDRRNIQSAHGVDPWVRYGEALAPYETAGFLWRMGDRFGLNRAGMLLANEILSTFV